MEGSPSGRAVSLLHPGLTPNVGDSSGVVMCSPRIAGNLEPDLRPQSGIWNHSTRSIGAPLPRRTPAASNAKYAHLVLDRLIHVREEGTLGWRELVVHLARSLAYLDHDVRALLERRYNDLERLVVDRRIRDVNCGREPLHEHQGELGDLEAAASRSQDGAQDVDQRPVSRQRWTVSLTSTSSTPATSYAASTSGRISPA